MQKVLEFLKDLSKNNNREWFNDNKSRYREARELFLQFTNILIAQIRAFDESIGAVNAKDSTFRIYRDTRFSKNKAPYKNNMGAYISRGGKKSDYAGYYFHLEPDNSFAGGGLYCPSSPVLKKVRNRLAENAEPLREIINSQSFKQHFSEMTGDKVKTAPRGFKKDHPNIDLLRHKSYLVVTHFSDKEILEGDIVNEIKENFKAQKAFNNYFNEVIDRK